MLIVNKRRQVEVRFNRLFNCLIVFHVCLPFLSSRDGCRSISLQRRELYPGDRADLIDFSIPGHESKLGEGWHDLEGIYGNKYRWMGAHSNVTLKRVQARASTIRLRGFAQAEWFEHGGSQSTRPTIELKVNGQTISKQQLERNGMIVIEAPVPAAAEYQLEILASPTWRAPGDQRDLTWMVSLIRLIEG